ncbi:hypothetical protein [Actinoplanes sp. NPDC026670]|uniref:hypothetical protein n=1 Tax=Actinoplanes sp. NPDC026670 TaxID=3154700 RepID=UPI0033D59CD4
MRPFKIITDDRVRVTATLVDHALGFPSFAYLFDTADSSIAARADVPTLLLNHLSPGNPALVPDATWLRKATTGYTRTVLIGNDL